MFIDLINLYKKQNTNRTPLEDFNTECFANILRLYKDVKEDFIKNFLQLPDDTYIIKTQLKKDLEKHPNCIIDLVFEGKENICFIENKVESHEGWEQLNRYGLVLDNHYSEKKKYLFYCTKYTDTKNQDNEYDNYNFRQFKWFEVAKFFKKYKKDNPLINDYLKFLTKYKMAQDNTFKAENLLSMENMVKTIEVAQFHIDNCKQEFNEMFGSANYQNNTHGWQQLTIGNRLCHYNTGILKGSSTKDHSEILYSIEFAKLRLRAQIYVNVKHPKYIEFKKLTFDKNIIKTWDFESGYCYYINADLGQFLNDDDSDKKIKDWFLNSFEQLKKLMDNNEMFNK